MSTTVGFIASPYTMSIDQYSDWTPFTWATEDDRALALMGLGLAGEVGEVIEKIKKHLRDGTPVDDVKMRAEMGDVLYYWARLAKYFGYRPSEIIKENVQKLTDRKARGKIHGEGDNR